MSARQASDAERVADEARGYMAGAYGPEEWRKVAAFLLSEGLSEDEARAVLLSKHMRWADDFRGAGAGRPTDAVAFAAYYVSGHASARELGEWWRAEASRLVAESAS